MRDTVAIITARNASRRLPGKNMLPIGGIPLAVRSIYHALEADLPCVVSTDIPELETAARALGVDVVRQPAICASERYGGTGHDAAIRHALKQAAPAARRFVLLQPTSPFRTGNIVRRCLEASEDCDVRTVYGGHLLGRQLWDGCVWVGSADVNRNAPFIAVENLWKNSLQVDSQLDYDQAHQLFHGLDAT